MAEQCLNCGEKITGLTIFGAPNNPLSDEAVRIVNFIDGTSERALCNKCGGEREVEARGKLAAETRLVRERLRRVVGQFPMMTIGVLPAGNDFRVLGMVTANVTVGTGLFNEFSQGFSDTFGAMTTSSGMSGKVNKGEAAARSLLIEKALDLGGNCIIGVDIDYGVTGNNSATVNMQGTAVSVANLATVMGEGTAAIADWIRAAWQRMPLLERWAAADFRSGETYERKTWELKLPQ